MKRPSFQFYPGDWQHDPALRACSVGARGLWIEMICIMHQAEPYGHLVLNHRPVEILTLAQIVGASHKEVSKWLAELEGAGVFSRTEDIGVIYSRRMLRDEEIREVRANYGRLGGNPMLLAKSKANHQNGGAKVIPMDNPRDNTPDKLDPTPSSSSSSSSSKHTPPTPSRGVPDTFARFWSIYPRKVNRTKAEKVWGKLNPEEALVLRILESVKAWSASDAWQRDGGEYVPHASTWLNGRRWEDETPLVGGRGREAPSRYPTAREGFRPAATDGCLYIGEDEPPKGMYRS